MYKCLAIGVIISLAACSNPNTLRPRPASWATPLINTTLKNAYQVDHGVYRSEQPSSREFQALATIGIQEVLNLREFHSDDDEASEQNINRHHLKIDTGSINQDQLIAALTLIKNRKGPILVHCWHGADRTGAVIAAYRIIFNNWSKEKAIDELINGGYGYHQRTYPNIVTLIENLDVEKVEQMLNTRPNNSASRF